jgi:hypothetical protein
MTELVVYRKLENRVIFKSIRMSPLLEEALTFSSIFLTGVTER